MLVCCRGGTIRVVWNPSSNLGLIKKLKIKTPKNIKQRKEVEDAKK
nr:MAG TPA: hypothetical protein [Caudoviricetes sp.]